MPDRVIVALSMMPLIPLRMAEGAKGEGKEVNEGAKGEGKEVNNEKSRMRRTCRESVRDDL